MKEFMKKFLYALICVLATPLVLLFALGLGLYIPVDYVRYRRCAFYKDTGHKYELFSGNTQWIRLYNAMRAEDLPLDFHFHSTREVTYGYFRYKNILLVQDYPAEYDPNSGEWFVCYDKDDKEPCTPLAEALKSELEGFNDILGEKRCDRAVLLVDRRDFADEDLPHLESCPLLLGYDGQRNMAPAIKQWIKKNRG